LVSSVAVGSSTIVMALSGIRSGFPMPSIYRQGTDVVDAGVMVGVVIVTVGVVAEGVVTVVGVVISVTCRKQDYS